MIPNHTAQLLIHLALHRTNFLRSDFRRDVQILLGSGHLPANPLGLFGTFCRHPARFGLRSNGCSYSAHATARDEYIAVNNSAGRFALNTSLYRGCGRGWISTCSTSTVVRRPCAPLLLVTEALFLTQAIYGCLLELSTPAEHICNSQL